MQISLRCNSLQVGILITALEEWQTDFTKSLNHLKVGNSESIAKMNEIVSVLEETSLLLIELYRQVPTIERK